VLYREGAVGEDEPSQAPANSNEELGHVNIVAYRRLVHATLNPYLDELVERVGKKSLVKDINR
jgi:hypothetical protein